MAGVTGGTIFASLRKIYSAWCIFWGTTPVEDPDEDEISEDQWTRDDNDRDVPGDVVDIYKTFSEGKVPKTER